MATATLDQLRRGELRGARRLKLACGLTEFPRELFELADSLEILDLSGNALDVLPDDLPRLHRLRVLFASNNRFRVLPPVLGQCAGLSMVGFKANRIAELPAEALPPSLRWLILTDNAIPALPSSIGRCASLQKLMLAGNRLADLPRELAACTRLELLRLAANRLDALPDWLLTLPRLSWLAFAGNPLAAAREAAVLAQTPIRAVPWAELELTALLGEGASGVIHRAEQRRGGRSQPVAVKLFKSGVTSDGLPHCEMSACLGAGEHPNLIPPLGRVVDHPDGGDGLVMQLIDPAFRSLAGPPSFDSCTRDVYDDGCRFALPAVLGIARDIAAAAHHLHRRGIMHGDLYGHNILHCGNGRALLGDFGAASLFFSDNAVALPLQRLEVRAFGCLLEELVERCVAPGDAAPVLDRLRGLSAACLAEVPHQRPLFGELEARLGELAAA